MPTHRYTEVMTETFQAPELPDDLESISDRTAVDYMKQLVRDRRDKGIMIPRFVQALNKAGYSISLSEYKEAEQRPFNAVPHIRNGMTYYAYRVLNKTRVENSQQDKLTAYAMTRLADARIAQGLSYLEMSQRISAALSLPISEAEYRTAEQGIAKAVPFSWVIAAARILKLDLGGMLA